MSKKYYWIKLSEHFFEDDKILYLETINNGEKYIVIWMKLLLKCLRDKEDEKYGFLRFSDSIPYDDTMLAKILRCDIDTLRVAMKYFVELGMIEILEDKTIYIRAVQEMIGGETDAAERMRRHRDKIKQIEYDNNIEQKCNNSEHKCNNVTEERNNVTKKCNNVTKMLRHKEEEVEIEVNKISKNSEKNFAKNEIVDNFDNSVDNSFEPESEPEPKKNLWDQILIRMQKEINPAAYNSWLLKTKLIGISNSDNIIKIKVKDEVHQKHIGEQYIFDLTTIAKEITNKMYEFEFIV